MKEEALKLADELEGWCRLPPAIDKEASAMIRRLVEELDKHK